MSSVLGERAPAKMASRSWSTNTLKRGVSQVLTDVKQEPWVEGDDASLQARLQVGLPLFPNNIKQITNKFNNYIIHFTVIR